MARRRKAPAPDMTARVVSIDEDQEGGAMVTLYVTVEGARTFRLGDEFPLPLRAGELVATIGDGWPDPEETGGA